MSATSKLPGSIVNGYAKSAIRNQQSAISETVKAKTVFSCQECGAQSQKWLGRCAECGAWNSLVEERPAELSVVATSDAAKRYSLAATAGPQLYADIDSVVAERLTTGIDEFDRVLGGGVVPGSLVLIGGEPGIGKSTLLLQAAAHFAHTSGPVLYSSGEESEHQIKSRGDRLGIDPSTHGEPQGRPEQSRGAARSASSRAVSSDEPAPLYILAETCLERILEEVARLKPSFIIVDSIQTVFSLRFQSAPGSIGQVREAATQLLFAAKGQNVPTFLVGHVTKDGNIAGPKALEHIVDTVLYFEGEKHHAHRVVRAVKNRFGAVSEVGVFEMTSVGLKAVPNPSKVFLAERPVNASGSAVLCCVEGSRPMLVEIQALVSTSTYGNARRMASGLDHNRLSLLLAVLEKRAGLNLAGDDVFVNVAGGITVDEPAADLAIAAAVASSVRNRPVKASTAVFGEIGLAGEVRGVSQAALRVREAAQMGFSRCVVAHGNCAAEDAPERCEIVPVRNVSEALDALIDW
jgi:DNA repair protein RadA/Sms